ncbi:MAG: hypothetical protein AAGL24_04980 [Pseudomonadota bacterium]
MAKLDQIIDDPSITPVIFNLHAAVGQGFARNLPEDVLLIQTYLSFLSTMTSDTELKKAASGIRITGVMDTATQDSILVYQTRMHGKGLGARPDGKVSPTNRARYGSYWFTLPMMSITVRKYCPHVWPRIDKIPGAQVAISQLVERELTGKSTTTV